MLEIIRINDFAIIDKVEVEFGTGLNIISGETGAGKSILMDAISIILGGRAKADLIRKGKTEAVVEALFDISDIAWVKERLSNLGFDRQNNELLIKRVVQKNGRSRVYINGQLGTVTLLQELSHGLVDVCGQSENHQLLRPSYQLAMLDRYGGLSELSGSWRKEFRRYQNLLSELSRLEEASADKQKQADFIKFQIDEIVLAELQEEEDVSLANEKSLLSSVKARAELSGNIINLVSDSSDGNITEMARLVQSFSSKLVELDSTANEVLSASNRVSIEVEELESQITSYSNSLSTDPEREAEVRNRLSQIASLKRKYGDSVSEVHNTLQILSEELKSIEDIDNRSTKIKIEIASARSELATMADKISLARSNVASVFSKTVTNELRELNMSQSRFNVSHQKVETELEWTEFSAADRIEFEIETNKGEKRLPIAKIASGGEISRLMLSIRRVISDKGSIGVYLFDEVDSGIGGSTAYQVGKKLKSVASQNQVICITHLPQVAAFADRHFVVSKSEVGKRTQTAVTCLNENDGVNEIARMLAGDKITKSSLTAARDLIRDSHV